MRSDTHNTLNWTVSLANPITVQNEKSFHTFPSFKINGGVRRNFNHELFNFLLCCIPPSLLVFFHLFETHSLTRFMLLIQEWRLFYSLDSSIHLQKDPKITASLATSIRCRIQPTQQQQVPWVVLLSSQIRIQDFFQPFQDPTSTSLEIPLSWQVDSKRTVSLTLHSAYHQKHSDHSQPILLPIDAPPILRVLISATHRHLIQTECGSLIELLLKKIVLCFNFHTILFLGELFNSSGWVGIEFLRNEVQWETKCVTCTACILIDVTFLDGNNK